MESAPLLDDAHSEAPTSDGGRGIVGGVVKSWSTTSKQRFGVGVPLVIVCTLVFLVSVKGRGGGRI